MARRADASKTTGVDVFLGRGTETELNRNNDDEEDEEEETQGYIKVRWNLNAPLHNQSIHPQLHPESFDLINSRMLAEGINRARWPAYLGELKRLLKPSGVIQLVELDLCIQSYNGSLPDESCIRRWWNVYQEAMTRLDKNARIGRSLRRLLEEQEFGNISGQFVDVPIGEWNPGRL